MLTKRDRIRKGARRARLWLTGRRGEARLAFVFGEMRSGTNMVIRTLANCGDTECYFEHDEEAFDDFVLRGKQVILDLVARSRARVVIFKPIADSAQAKEMLDWRPKTTGVWIYRRYQDVVNSALALWSEHNKYLHYMLHEPEAAGWRVRNVPAESLDLIRQYYDRGISEASARALIWYVRNNLYFQQNLQDDGRILLLNYERVVEQPDSEFSRIAYHFGCNYHDGITKRVHRKSVRKQTPPELETDVASLCESLYRKLESARRRPENGQAAS